MGPGQAQGGGHKWVAVWRASGLHLRPRFRARRCCQVGGVGPDVGGLFKSKEFMDGVRAACQSTCETSERSALKAATERDPVLTICLAECSLPLLADGYPRVSNSARPSGRSLFCGPKRGWIRI